MTFAASTKIAAEHKDASGRPKKVGDLLKIGSDTFPIIGIYETRLTEPHPYWPWTRQRNRRAWSRLTLSGQLFSGAKRCAPLPPPPRPSAMR